MDFPTKSEDHFSAYLQKLSLNAMDVCRLCVNAKSNMKPMAENWDLYCLFEEVTSIKLEVSDKYPKSICHECELNLQTSVVHIRNFREVDAFWRNYLFNDLQPKGGRDRCSPIEQVKLEVYDSFDNFEPTSQQPVETDVFENVSSLVKVELSTTDDHHVQGIPLPGQIKKTASRKNKKRKRNPNQHDCHICGQAHTCNRNLLYHMENQHNSLNGYICDYCREQFISKLVLRRHLKTHLEFKCSICQKVFGNKFRLANHEKLHSRTVEDMVVCVPCNKTFIDKGTYRDHMRYLHSNLYEAPCPECGKVYSSPKRMRVHMLRHSKAKRLQCSECDKMFLQKQELIVHLRVHSGERPYVCEACGSAFKAMRSLQKHYRIHEEQMNSGTTIACVGATSLPQPFSCTLCEKAFARNTTLQKHLKRSHPDEAYAEWQKLIPLICLKCNQIFPSLESIKHHNELHHQHYQCDICKKFLNTEESLQYHIQAHSTKIRRFKCEICGAAFLKGATLRSHHRRAHTTDRPFNCPICQKSFVKNCDVNGHIKSVHNKQKPYVCTICSKTYRSPSLLKQHEQKHTGIYRYRCEPCEKNFATSQQYAKHNLKAHLPSVPELI